MQYKTLDELSEEESGAEVAFFSQLLPDDATEKERKFFKKMVSKLSLRGIYEKPLIDFFKQREPRRFYDDLWTLKTEHQRLEKEYEERIPEFLEHASAAAINRNVADTLWRVEFFKGEMKLKGEKWKKGEPIPKNIQRCFQVIDRALKQIQKGKDSGTSIIVKERASDKLLKEREKLVKRYGEP